MRSLPPVLSLFALLTLGCFVFKDEVADVPPSMESRAPPDFVESGVDSPPPDDSPAPSWTRYEYSFDELAAMIVDSHYAEFSVTPDEGLHMVAYPATTLARSQPNCLYVASEPGAAGSAAAFTLTFARPARGLRFFHSGDTTAGEVAGVDLTLESGETVNLTLSADGSATTAELADLSAHEGVTSLRVRDMLDPSGLAYDDLSFELRDGE